MLIPVAEPTQNDRLLVIVKDDNELSTNLIGSIAFSLKEITAACKVAEGNEVLVWRDIYGAELHERNKEAD